MVKDGTKNFNQNYSLNILAAASRKSSDISEKRK